MDFVIDDHNMIIQHVKKANGRKVGTFVARRYGNSVGIGWSKCRVAVDEFDTMKGIELAASRALAKEYQISEQYDQSPFNLPDSMFEAYRIFLKRAQRYFYKNSRKEQKVLVSRNKPDV